MSTKNTSTTGVDDGKLATGEQIEHIMDMWRRRLKKRSLTLAEANHLIQNGGKYVPVMYEAADVLVDKMRSDKQGLIVRMVRNIQRKDDPPYGMHMGGFVIGSRETSDILRTIPWNDEPKDVELVYFKAGHIHNEKDLEEAYKARDLKPDIRAQITHNMRNNFCLREQNGCRIKIRGKFATFHFGEKYGKLWIEASYRERNWSHNFLFAGVRA